MMHIEYFTSFLKHLGHDLSDWRLVEGDWNKEWHCYCVKGCCGKMFMIHHQPQEWCLVRIHIKQYGLDQNDEIMKLNERELRAWTGEMSMHREKATIYKHLLCAKTKVFQ